MENRNISGRQLGAWLLCALSAPLAQMAGGTPWVVVLVTGVVCLAASWYANRTKLQPGKLICALEFAWIPCVLGAAFRWIVGSWPSGDVYPAIPLVLLALAAACASGGEGKAAGAGSVLFWLTALIYSAVVIAGIGEVEPAMLRPDINTGSWELAAVFLIPAAAGLAPGMRRKLQPISLVAMAVFSTVISILIAGSVSPAVAQSVESPLYQWVRGLGLFGTLERFEALVAVALTMGWFAALSYLLCVAGSLAEWLKPGWFKTGVWICAGVSAAGIFLDQWIGGAPLAIGSVILWIALPAGSNLRVKIKMKKLENNA